MRPRVGIGLKCSAQWLPLCNVQVHCILFLPVHPKEEEKRQKRLEKSKMERE